MSRVTFINSRFVRERQTKARVVAMTAALAKAEHGYTNTALARELHFTRERTSQLVYEGKYPLLELLLKIRADLK